MPSITWAKIVYLPAVQEGLSSDSVRVRPCAKRQQDCAVRLTVEMGVLIVCDEELAACRTVALQGVNNSSSKAVQWVA